MLFNAMKRENFAVMSYIFGFVSAFYFLYTHKEKDIIRLSASQSFVFSFLVLGVGIFLHFIPIFGHAIFMLFMFVSFLLWVKMVTDVAKGTYYKLPIISKISEKYVINWFI